MGEFVGLPDMMRISQYLALIPLILMISGKGEERKKKQFSLFSVVQFPNDVCTSASSSTTIGTCYTTSECTSRGGGAEGTCAAGFGVCCVISTSECSATVSTNNTYIRNPGYPTSYTPTTTGTCTNTIKKMSDDICQLRLDFETMTGYTFTTAGACTATFQATGGSGRNPPAICGTNTGFHMYVEFGAASSDDIELKTSYDAVSKQWNILTRQISCTASWKAPPDCVQYFTGVSGSIKSYNFGQIIQGQDYSNCIRQEKNYCRVKFTESSIATPDPFDLDTVTIGTATAAGGVTGSVAIAATVACALAFVEIANGSENGITPLNAQMSLATSQSTWCGSALGYTGQPDASRMAIVSARQPFRLGVWTAPAGTALGTSGSGFNLDYTQLAC